MLLKQNFAAKNSLNVLLEHKKVKVDTFSDVSVVDKIHPSRCNKLRFSLLHQTVME